MKVCLAANTIRYPDGGGHRWVYLNWALGLRALGCTVVWLEELLAGDDVATNVTALKRDLARYGLADSVALFGGGSEPLPPTIGGYLGLADVDDADLFLNVAYDIPADVVRRFRRTALVDIDPGLTQLWMMDGGLRLARHDRYFTTGETVGNPDSRIPTVGLNWEYVPPCVAIGWWPRQPPPATTAAFTTVAHWYDGWEELDGKEFTNGKRSGFVPFLELPSRTPHPLELALDLKDDDEDHQLLTENGWRVRDAASVASTSGDYQHYVQSSRGEFSCVKPSCVLLQNAWISDRTLCYLASGRPAVIEHTGPSRFLPEAEGLLRFRDLPQAARFLEMVVSDYERQSRRARALAEEYFDAAKVLARVLERTL